MQSFIYIRKFRFPIWYNSNFYVNLDIFLHFLESFYFKKVFSRYSKISSKHSQNIQDFLKISVKLLKNKKFHIHFSQIFLQEIGEEAFWGAFEA